MPDFRPFSRANNVFVGVPDPPKGVNDVSTRWYSYKHELAGLPRAFERGRGDPANLPGPLSELARCREDAGTADKPFGIHVASMDAYSTDGVRKLPERGSDDIRR